MLGEKFYNNISSLNNPELNSFIRYSKSSFLNKNNELTNTLELYKKNKIHFKNLLESESLLFKMLFPKEKKNQKKTIKDHFYSCEKLLEEFIVFHVSQNDKESKLNILSEFYHKKNNSKAALSANTKLLSLIEKKQLNYKNYYKLFKVNLDRFYILLNDFSYETFKYAEKSIDFLDKYYFLEKFSINKHLLTDSIMSNRKYDIRLIDEIKSVINKNSEISEELLFKIFSISLESYKGNVHKETLHTFIDLIYTHIDKFDKDSKMDFLEDINNYISILYSKTNDNSLLTSLFENYKRQIEVNTHVVNGHIPDANFAQVIRISLYLKEYEWAKNFIKEHDKFLNNKDLVLISLAEISYTEKDYNKTLELLNNVDLKTTKHNYELKSLYAKTLYDTKEFDLLENHLNTFEIYLRRQQELSDLIKDNNLRFVLYLKRLLHNQFKKTGLNKLKIEVEKDKQVFNKNWILARLNSIL